MPIWEPTVCSNTMRTKRRNALKRANNSEKKSQKPGNASVNRWNRREEIEFDDEDACKFLAMHHF